jgi:hypothetical protein
MPYLHSKTFELTGEDMRRDTDYFEVDELLAFAIQMLNKKGYYTYVCCEGHPFVYVRYLDIAFHDSVDLPYLPEGFYFEHCRLRYDYTEQKSLFGFSREMTDVCEALTKWAAGLPENPFREL